MKYFKKLIPLFMLSVIFLFGCASDDTMPSFSLSRVGMDADPEIPQLYVVSPPEDTEKLNIYYPSDPYTQTDGYHEAYDLEAVTVNEKEIIVEFEGEVMRFNRLSSTIAETEEKKIWYQYITLEEQEAMN